jgi:SOS-response transcriptional repressor LexA
MSKFGFDQPYPGQEVFHPQPGTILNFNTIMMSGPPDECLPQAGEHNEHVADSSNYLISNLNDTFFVRVKGDAMTESRIEEGDILIVDRSLKPEHDKIVVAIQNGGFIIRRLQIENGVAQLEADNPGYPTISLSEASDTEIWGVVTSTMHSVDDVDPMVHLFGGK